MTAPMALRNCTLLDCTGADPAPRSTVLVENGRITRVARGAEPDLPRGAEAVDCGGRTLMRLSPERVLRADIILLLGRDAERAADIGLVWNDREDQIVRIIDDAALRASRQAAWEDAFELFDADDRDRTPHRLYA